MIGVDGVRSRLEMKLTRISNEIDSMVRRSSEIAHEFWAVFPAQAHGLEESRIAAWISQVVTELA